MSIDKLAKQFDSKYIEKLLKTMNKKDLEDLIKPANPYLQDLKFDSNALKPLGMDSIKFAKTSATPIKPLPEKKGVLKSALRKIADKTTALLKR